MSTRKTLNPSDRRATDGDDEQPGLPPHSAGPSDSTNSVYVAIRVRPLNQKEVLGGTGACVEVDRSSGRVVVRPPRPEPGRNREEEFSFDRVMGPDASQEEAYASTGEILLQRFMDGYNGTIMAYGQTSSGKTHSMVGVPGMPGIIPQIAQDLFAALARRGGVGGEGGGGAGLPTGGGGSTPVGSTPVGSTPVGSTPAVGSGAAGGGGARPFTVTVTYVEIYMEHISDLLSSKTPQITSVRGGKSGSVGLKNVDRREVGSAAELLALLEQGGRDRHVGATAMNAQSSRSHSVFTIYLQQNADQGDSSQMEKASAGQMTSKLQLVDLAGSERVENTQSEGQRLKEAGAINKSLSALGNVVNALSSGKRVHIPYRDSKLTHMLQDSIGGNSITMMICMLSPAAANADESISTLGFADRAKHIKNVAKKNLDPQAARVALLVARIQALQVRSATNPPYWVNVNVNVNVNVHVNVNVNVYVYGALVCSMLHNAGER